MSSNNSALRHALVEIPIESERGEKARGGLNMTKASGILNPCSNLDGINPSILVHKFSAPSRFIFLGKM